MSKSGAYYNEFDPKAAAWLRELIKRGLIADGEVDERSIIDVAHDDVRGFTQCHWFAGLGGWSKSLRFAGWPDDEPVWTGSPPCQPFSAAGQQRGSADERHLAPHFAELIASARPSHVFGEQVASAAVFGKPAKGARGALASQPEWAWIDDLFGRLEDAHYACGASDIPAAGVGAPHLRQRTFFVGVRMADANRNGSQGRLSGWSDAGREAVNGSAGCDGAVDDMEHATGDGLVERRAESSGRGLASGRGDGGLADAHGNGSLDGFNNQEGWRTNSVAKRSSDGGLGDPSGAAGQRNAGTFSGTEAGEHGAGQSVDGREPVGSEHAGASVGGLADASSLGRGGRKGPAQRREHDGPDAGWQQSHDGSVGSYEVGDGSRWPGPTNGHWRSADWLFCRDGKWRPVESSLFGMADGLPAGMVRGGDIVPACYPLAQKSKTDTRRSMRLKGYGNAIVPAAAAVFIKSVMEITQ